MTVLSLKKHCRLPLKIANAWAGVYLFLQVSCCFSEQKHTKHCHFQKQLGCTLNEVTKTKKICDAHPAFEWALMGKKKHNLNDLWVLYGNTPIIASPPMMGPEESRYLGSDYEQKWAVLAWTWSRIIPASEWSAWMICMCVNCGSRQTVDAALSFCKIPH